jgi:5-methylcytosine-specific restriction endonuclease McrA
VDAVLAINADLGPLHRVSIKHAIRMLCRQVAVVYEAEPDRLLGIYPLPRVVRLVRYVVARWRYTSRPPWSRRGVMQRNHYRCAYCGRTGTTVDHVVPQSRGGPNTWTNTVAACGGCNQRKGDRTPAEARMRLRLTPATPTWAMLSPR